MKIKKTIVDLFVGENDYKKYAFGRNDRTKLILDYVKLDGVIDEYTTENVYDCNGSSIPIIHDLSLIENHSIVVNTLMEGYPVTVQNKLKKFSFLSTDVFALKKYSTIPISMGYCEGFSKLYSDKKSEFDAIYSRIQEKESRTVFEKIIAFRNDLDLKQMKGFSVNLKSQYFEPFLQLKENDEVFVDVGGYDGNTSLEFIKRCQNYNHIYFWEPEQDFMNKSKANLSAFDNITFVEAGAWNENATLSFSLEGNASNINEKGTVRINVKTLDSVLLSSNQPITFIKMDIEGSEANAIDGARNIILRDHPRLAICAYHKNDDFVEIPKHVFAIRDDYDIYLRHYTEGVLETVMFFMPKH